MQKLILFENILNPNAIATNEMFRKELEAISNYVFGEAGFSVEDGFAKSDGLHDWCSGELDKFLRRDTGPVCPVKTSFEEIKNEGASDKCSGPLKMWFFEPDGALDDQIILITCHWTDGLFSNDHYVIGMMVTDTDLEHLEESL